jgi:serine protease Do
MPNKVWGSGIFVEKINSDYYILTNNHVVKDAESIKVVFINDREYDSELVGRDERSDLAVLKFSGKEDIAPVKIGKSSDVQIGDWAIAVGNPFGFNGTFTVGVISALSRAMLGRNDATDYIQTDAAINPGNSGGPLLNIQGEVIGVNSWIATLTGTNTGLSFAIPIDNAMAIYEKLKKFKKVEYPWLGISIKSVMDLDRKSLEIDTLHGAYIFEIVKESPAEKTDLKVGDIIVAIDGKTIRDANELIWTISKYSPGDTVKVTYLRDNVKKDLSITLTKRPDETDVSGQPNTAVDKTKIEEINFLGAYFTPVDDKTKSNLGLPSSNGVLITKLDKASPAADYGLKVNDVVKKINATSINNINDLKALIKKSTDNKVESFYFTIIRQGRDVIIGVQK